jgi:type IV pilus assembly protein PilC
LVSAAGAAGNAKYTNAILDIRLDVMGGMQLNTAMRATQIFPPMMNQMVMIGEEAGSLDSMLNKVSSIYQQEVDDAVDGLSSMLEPLIMVILGVVIGSLVIAMYLPIFTMGSVIK